MPSIVQVRDAITAAVTPVPALNGRVSSGFPSLINPPCAVVHRRRTDRGIEFNGGNQTTFMVTIYLSFADLPTAQATMDGLLTEGAGSVIAALEADTSLGGLVNWLTIPTIDEEGLIEMAGLTYYSASVSVLVSHN